MSRFESKVSAQKAGGPKSTADILSEAGMLPNQKRARRMMEGARLGFKNPNVSKWRLNIAWIRRMKAAFTRWQVFTVADYACSNTFMWGGPIPDSVIRRIDRMRALIPSADIRIHAIPEDPWVVVDGLIVAGWKLDTIFL